MTFNTITVSGNLTADPETTLTQSGLSRTRFSVAVSRPVRQADGSWDDHFDGFFNVVCWRTLADHVAATLRKGDRVVVAGRLQRRAYEHEDDNGETQTRHIVELDADEVAPSLRFHSWTPQVQTPSRMAAVGTTAPTEDSGSRENSVIAAA